MLNNISIVIILVLLATCGIELFGWDRTVKRAEQCAVKLDEQNRAIDALYKQSQKELSAQKGREKEALEKASAYADQAEAMMAQPVPKVCEKAMQWMVTQATNI